MNWNGMGWNEMSKQMINLFLYLEVTIKWNGMKYNLFKTFLVAYICNK